MRATELVFDGSKLEIDSDQFSSGSLACICRIKGNPDDTRTLTFSLKSHNEVTEREDEDCGHRLEIAVHGAVHEFNCSENEWQVENFALDNVSIALFVEVPINKSMDYELSIQGIEYLSHVMRKHAVIAQLISALVSLHRKHNPSTTSIRNFKLLAIFYGCTARFVSELVGNPE